MLQEQLCRLKSPAAIEVWHSRTACRQAVDVSQAVVMCPQSSDNMCLLLSHPSGEKPVIVYDAISVTRACAGMCRHVHANNKPCPPSADAVG